MNLPDTDPAPQKQTTNTMRVRNLGLIGALLAAFSLINAYDALVDFSGIVKHAAEKWRILITAFWNFIFNLFNFPKITRFDAVFLTFFFMTTATLLTSFNFTDPNLSKTRFRQGIWLTITGMLIISGLFTAGDITTYNILATKYGPNFYQNSIQAYFYDAYVNLLKPYTWGIPSQYGEITNDFILYIFYTIITIVIFLMAFLLSYLVRLYVNMWSMASRTWMIIMFFSILVAFNYITIYLENNINLTPN